MFGNNPRKQVSFLFKCNSCETILDVKFEEDEEIDKTNENKMELDCDCRSDIILYSEANEYILYRNI